MRKFIPVLIALFIISCGANMNPETTSASTDTEEVSNAQQAMLVEVDSSSAAIDPSQTLTFTVGPDLFPGCAVWTGAVVNHASPGLFSVTDPNIYGEPIDFPQSFPPSQYWQEFTVSVTNNSETQQTVSVKFSFDTMPACPPRM